LGDSSLTGNVGARVVNVKNASSGYFQQNTASFVRNGTIYNHEQFGRFTVAARNSPAFCPRST
jgi:hypothetical protein